MVNTITTMFTHDPSTLIREGNKYYFFSTGNGILARMSEDRVNWTELSPIFKESPAWTTDAVPGFKGHFWAPDIAFFNDQYHLYYSVSTFGKQTSAIAVATSKSLDPNHPDHHWTDHGPVIQSNESSPYNAIDPAIFIDNDESVWMSFGSFWGGIYLVELDPQTGLRKYPEQEAIHLASKEQIEAPYITRRGDWYYLFINWGWCCRGLKSTYNIRIGRSRDIKGPYLDHDNVPLTTGGGTLLLEAEEHRLGPGHAGILIDDGKEWFTYHYYNALNEGKPAYALREILWNEEGWPTFGCQE